MRISSIECGRVVAIGRDDHPSLPFQQPLRPALWDAPYPLVGAVINQLCRFAVPLFFLCASYFLQPPSPQATR